jgi:carboxypeptidase T
MKKLYLFLLVILSLNAQGQKEIYHQIKIDLQNTTLANLAAYGLEVDHAHLHNNTITLIAREDEIDSLIANKINYTILQKDMVTFYASRLAKGKATLNKKTRSLACDKLTAPIYTKPNIIDYGTMGGYLTYYEAMLILDSLATKYPNIMKAKSAIDTFTTVDGNSIFYYKISDNPTVNENEPEILYNAVHHAREVISVFQLVYYMAYLCENYATNDEVKRLVDNTEMYFVPFVNPDGYIYNEQTFGVGGLWRKNRRFNGGTNYGVDLNRNYPKGWAFNNTGSSNNPSSNTYRGPSAGSEQETKAMMWLCNNHNFIFAQNYHSYSDLWIYPWGYLNKNTNDSVQYRAWAKELTKYNYYKFGTDLETVGYSTNGSSDDWMYSDSAKTKIFAATPEVGDFQDGFWPDISRIFPLCDEALYMNLTTAKFLLPFASLQNIGNRLQPYNNINAYYKITRLGYPSANTYTVNVIPISAVLNAPSPKTYSGLALGVSKEDSITLTLNSFIPNNTPITFVLELDNGIWKQQDTITQYIGVVNTIFYDSCENINKWDVISGNFNVEAKPYTGTYSITENPNGLYDSGAFYQITSKDTFNLQNAEHAELRYRVKWSTLNNQDNYFISVNEVGSVLTYNLCGLETIPYSNGVTLDEECYTGVQPIWQWERINLDDWLGKKIHLSFYMSVNGNIRKEGINLDDIHLTIIPKQATAINQNLLAEDILFYPNPSKGIVYFNNTFNKVNVYSMDGKLVLESKNCNSINVANLASGIYKLGISTKNNTLIYKQLKVQ